MPWTLTLFTPMPRALVVVEIENLDKREIEGFIVWYSPAILLTFFIYGSLYLYPEGISFGTKMDIVSSYLGHAICGIWLIINAPKRDLNKWLWAFFGLGLGIYSILFYFLYCTTNKKRNDADGSDEPPIR